MELGTLETVGSAKLLIVLIILAGASIMDLRYRRIPDRFWIIMIIFAYPLLAWEMWLKGARDSPVTLLSLLLPGTGFLFIIFGYPEPKEVLKGSASDIVFTLIYLGAIIGGAVAFFLGDRSLLTEVGISLIFMTVYFVLYTVPIAGARLIHGGADAKCLISLAALFPWYITDLPFQLGPFYSTMKDIPALGTIFPVHLSILFNAAVISALVVILMIPLINILKGNLQGLRPTSYMADVEGLEGKFVWIMENKEKSDPTSRAIRRLKERGVDRVRVTPKIPFIMYLALGAVAHAILGNLVVAVILHI
ncbi:MAG: hypothetical protein U9R75_00235 [Candidatus Thermoplasmatota archaeon]|nr:hypothetical protein [Candidatus Thermoplasmatota archaeon]